MRPSSIVFASLKPIAWALSAILFVISTYSSLAAAPMDKSLGTISDPNGAARIVKSTLKTILRANGYDLIASAAYDELVAYPRRTAQMRKSMLAELGVVGPKSGRFAEVGWLRALQGDEDWHVLLLLKKGSLKRDEVQKRFPEAIIIEVEMSGGAVDSK